MVARVARKRGAARGRGAAKPAGDDARQSAAGRSREPGERARRAGWWLAAVALTLPPLLVVPRALDAFRLPQRMAAEWLALASLVPLALAGVARRVDGRPYWRHPALLAVLPLLALAALSLVTTRRPLHVAEALADLAIFAATLVGWSLAFRPDSLRRLCAVTWVPAVALSAIGLLQLYRLWQPVIFAADPGSERQAMTSLAGNPGDLAAFLVLPCLLAQAELAAGRRRVAWAVVLLLCGYALAATQTLTSVAALAVGSLLYWALVLPPRRALLGAAAGAAAIVLLVLGVPGLRQRVADGLQAVRRGELDLVLSGRLDGWRVATALLAERPLAGAGHGAYRAEFARVKLALLARGETFFRGHVNASFANAHNEYLEVGADLGWPGLAALAWGLVILGGAARRCWGRLPRSDSALVWAAMAAAAVLAVAYFPFRLGPTALVWCALLAWILAASDWEAAA